jgi:tRNA(fMet)-specific endonuclease VapC
MSLHVLDTDILTLFQLGHPVVCQRIANKAPSELAVTVVTVEEQLGGWYSYLRRSKKHEHLVKAYQGLALNARAISSYQILTFTLKSLQKRVDLSAEKLNVGAHDLGIAAIALEHSAIVVTRNRTDFERVPGLKIEDWSK